MQVGNHIKYILKLKSKIMKKSKYFKLLVGISVVLLVSCQNENISFPDFDYTTTYFPYQSPIRTLILGNTDQVDNTKDKLLQFSIGLRVAGMYENKKNWTVNYSVDNNLTRGLFNATNDSMLALPAKYYTLNPLSSVIVPVGSFVGNINVQLTNSFLDDTLSYRGVYVIPLRINTSTTDSILRGKLSTTVSPDTADVRVSTQWNVMPKDYTLFGIKFINAYHGTYLHRGIDVVKTIPGVFVQQNIYHTNFVETDELWSVKALGRDTVEVNATVKRTPSSPGSFSMWLKFNQHNDTCVIVSAKKYHKGLTLKTPRFIVAGSGKFVKEGDSWGGKKRDVIYLKYKITDTTLNEVHDATDTIVIRDRTVKFETFTITVKK